MGLDLSDVCPDATGKLSEPIAALREKIEAGGLTYDELADIWDAFGTFGETKSPSIVAVVRAHWGDETWSAGNVRAKDLVDSHPEELLALKKAAEEAMRLKAETVAVEARGAVEGVCKVLGEET